MDKLTQNEHAIAMRKNPQHCDWLCNITQNQVDMSIMYCALFDRLKIYEDAEDKKEFERELSDAYKRIKKKFENAPDYIKEYYNNNFATSKHAKKLPLKIEIPDVSLERKINEVVRCKDCGMGKVRSIIGAVSCEYMNGTVMSEDDFCSIGERREPEGR